MRNAEEAADEQRIRRERWGFTLVEFLTVIAIIAIIVAISIPIFTMYLHSADADTDKANVRNAKAIATYAALGIAEDVDPEDETPYYLDIDSGRLVKEVPVAYGKAQDHNGQVVCVRFLKTDAGYTYDITWEDGTDAE